MSMHLSRELNEKFGRAAEFHSAVDSNWPAIDRALRAVSRSVSAEGLRRLIRARSDQMTEVLLDRSASKEAVEQAKGALAAYRAIGADIDAIVAGRIGHSAVASVAEPYTAAFDARAAE